MNRSLALLVAAVAAPRRDMAPIAIGVLHTVASLVEARCALSKERRSEMHDDLVIPTDDDAAAMSGANLLPTWS